MPMKKKTFFERLAGNLRFSENEDEFFDDEQDEQIVRRAPLPQSRELPLSQKEDEIEEKAKAPLPSVDDDEVGELPVDVYETRDEIIIQTLIAGVSPEHLSINTTRDSITISGKREPNKTIANDAYRIRELYWGKFERTIELPEEVEIDNAEAIERHGMLLIKLPKLDKARKAVLKIKSI